MCPCALIILILPGVGGPKIMVLLCFLEFMSSLLYTASVDHSFRRGSSDFCGPARNPVGFSLSI